MSGLGERVLLWIRQNRGARRVAAWLGASYIALVDHTTRWDVRDKDHLHRMLGRDAGIIAAMWHGRLFMSPTFAPPPRRTVAMISNNRDGDLIAAIVAHWKVATVRGSTYDREKARDKGGAEAFAGAERELLARSVVAITPDGPRGPRMRAQAGSAQLALRTGASVIAVAFSTRWGWVLGSWDRFLLPLPFGRGVIIYREIPVPGSEDVGTEAALRAEIERVLTELTAEADRACGREPLTPGRVPEREPATP